MNNLLYILKKDFLEWFNDKSGDIATEVQATQKLFGEDNHIIFIIGNNKLDELAGLLVTPI